MTNLLLQENADKLLLENNGNIILNIPRKMLTTLQKVKDSLGIIDNSKDALLTDFIKQISAFIETACGGRIFEAVERTEYYDYPDGENVFLKNYPIQIPPDFDFFTAYRTGSISSPVWVDYTLDDYLIYPESGYIKFVSQFGGSTFDTGGSYRSLRVIYTGGYLIDWVNENDPQLHTLPADLTSLATQLCVKLFNKKASSGISAESTEGQSINYGSISDNDLSSEQKTVVSSYRRYAI